MGKEKIKVNNNSELNAIKKQNEHLIDLILQLQQDIQEIKNK